MRLYNDSRLLSLAGRHVSATTHAILAIEELGKSLFSVWNVVNVGGKRRTPTHIEKQSATLALLAAHELLSPRGQMLIARIKSSGRRPDFNEFGGYCKQLAFTRDGFLENLRMTLAYEDAKPPYDKTASVRAAKGLAKDLRRWVKDALKRRKSTSTMNLAAEIYKNGLGRL
mgnify:CR=1 FL=1